VSRLLISGYYGFGNAGDEAVLAAILTSLRRQAAALECAVLSAAPQVTRRLHGVPAFHRARPREVLAAMRGCDLFVSGGGSLLQDVTSLNSLLFYLLQIRMARMLRRRVMVYAQGIGPLVRPAARRLTARVLRGADWITVRDTESAAELERLGLKPGAPPVEVTADPVFALEPAPSEWARAELRTAWQGWHQGGRGAAPHPAGESKAATAMSDAAVPMLGISVREWPNLSAHLDALGEVIGEAAAEMEVTPVYFPLQRAQDAPACRRLAERAGGYVLPGDYAPGEWLSLAGQMSMFLAMRLHALIFAAVGGVPVIGLAYDPKVTALLARLGLQPATSLVRFDAAAVSQALYETWNVRQRRSVQIAEAARELAGLAEVSARRAVELLARGRHRRHGFGPRAPASHPQGKPFE
jgi:polysaccharide pyruvyl transferase CsaB